MGTKELTSKVRNLKELKQMAEELQAEITSIEDELKAEMTNRNTEEMLIDVFKIRWISFTSNRFDTTKFKAEHSDMYGAYTKQTTSKRFSVC